MLFTYTLLPEQPDAPGGTYTLLFCQRGRDMCFMHNKLSWLVCGSPSVVKRKRSDTVLVRKLLLKLGPATDPLQVCN
jgi:hypothetical protein